MGKKQVIFRADGNSNIGLGHIMRSLALADMLKDNFICEFATRFVSGFLKKEIKKVCSRIVELPQKDNEHFDFFLNMLTGNEIVVLDNYFFTTDYQMYIKEKGCKLVCIDDLADKHFVADLIINHSLGISENDYSVEDYTQLALGIDYILLRKNFFQIKHISKTYNLGIHRLFLSLGGSNNVGLLEKFLRIIDNTNIKEIHVLLPSNEEEYFINKNIKYNFAKQILFTKDLSAYELIKIIRSSDIAIVPSSTLSFEVLACNIPLITGYFTENQKKIYDGFSKYEQIKRIGDFNNLSEDLFLNIFNNYELELKKKFNGFNIISNNIPKNLINKFKTL